MKVTNTLFAITASSLRPTDITKLLHSSFVMLFQAFTAGSFSCSIVWGFFPPSISSSGDKLLAQLG